MYYQLDIALLPNKPSVKLFSKGLEIGDVTSPMKLLSILLLDYRLFLPIFQF